MCRQQTPHALPPNTNHHRYSTMTQPCHKDTTLNQQYCDNKHKGREEYNRSHDTTHSTAAATRQQCCTPPRTSPPATHNRKKKQSNTRRTRQHERDKTTRRCRTQPKTGDTVKRMGTTQDRGTTQHAAPAIQQGPQANNKGDASTRQGDAGTRTGGTLSTHPPFNAMPPTITMAPHHP